MEELATDEWTRKAFYSLKVNYFTLISTYIPKRPFNLPRKIRKLRFSDPNKLGDHEVQNNKTMCVGRHSYTGSTYLALSGLNSKRTLYVDMFEGKIMDIMNHGVEGVINFLEYHGTILLFSFDGKIYLVSGEGARAGISLKVKFKTKYTVNGSGKLNRVT